MRKVWIGLWLAVATVAGPEKDEAEKRFAAEVARLRDLDTSDQGLTSLRVTGRVIWDIECLYEAPHRHAVLLRDPSDGTPLLWLTDDRLFVYDPLKAEIVRFRTFSAEFYVHVEDESLRAGFKADTDPSETPSSRFEFRPRTFVDRMEFSRTVDTTLEGTTKIAALTGLHASVTMWLRGAGQYPCHAMQITGARGRPKLQLAFQANEPLPAAAFDAISPAKLTASDLAGRIRDGVIDKKDPLQFVGPAQRGAIARLGIHDTSLRNDFETEHGKPVDWDALAKSDRKISAQLRALYPVSKKREPDGVSELLAKLQPIDTGKNKPHTFALDGLVTLHRIELHERNGIERTICVRDPHDNTPLLMVDAKATYLYDVERQALIRVEVPVPSMQLQLRNKGLWVQFSWDDHDAGVRIDPKELLSKFGGPVTYVKHPDKLVAQRGNPLSFLMEFQLEREGIHRFRSLVHRLPGSPTQRIDLVANAELPAGWSRDRFTRVLDSCSLPTLGFPNGLAWVKGAP